MAKRSIIGARGRGQGMAGYALTLAGVALVCVVALYALGPRVGVTTNRVNSSIGGSTSSPSGAGTPTGPGCNANGIGNNGSGNQGAGAGNCQQ
jgi:hypothetical protein